MQKQGKGRSRNGTIKTPVEIESARKDEIDEITYLPAVSAYLRKEVLVPPPRDMFTK